MSELDAKHNPYAKRDMRRAKIRDFKFRIRMFFTGIFWRLLHAVRLGWPLQRLMCRYGYYRKFADGRCMFCGKKH